MNKSELISKIADSTNLSKMNADRAVNTMFRTILETLKNKEKVTLKNFGTFSVKTNAARKGRNPTTGEEINIPSKRVPKFIAGRKLKNEVTLGFYPNPKAKNIYNYAKKVGGNIDLRELEQEFKYNTEEVLDAMFYLKEHGLIGVDFTIFAKNYEAYNEDI